MKIIRCEQGGKEWLDLHVGRPTASQFHRLITPKTLKLSGQADAYRNELLAEEMVGHPLNDFVTDFIQRGADLEGDARLFYELQRGVEIEQVGFVLRDDERTGCSPDGFSGSTGGLEIKTPSAAHHVGYMLDGLEDKYKCQIQGCIWICERDWWDMLSYNPELRPVLTRYDRDEAFITALAAAVDQFVTYLDESRDKLATRGYINLRAAA